MSSSPPSEKSAIYPIYHGLFHAAKLLEKTNQEISLEIQKTSLPTAEFERINQSIKAFKSTIEKLGSINPPLQDKDRFWSSVRQELSAPINVINGYSKILLEDLKSSPLPSLKEKIQTFLVINAESMKSIEKFSREKLSLKKPSMGSLSIENSLPKKEKNNSPAAESLQENTPLKPELLSNATILIIENQEEKSDILKRRLVMEGYTVLEVDEEILLLEQLKTHSVDLILLDLNIQKMDGYKTLETLKKEEASQHIPVIIFSTFNEIDQTAQFIELGVDDYLIKPLNPILLRARINNCLEKKRLYEKEYYLRLKIASAQKTLETAIESIDYGFVLFDEKGRCTLTNNAFRSLYPWTHLYPSLTYSLFLKHCAREKIYTIPNPKQWMKDRLKQISLSKSTAIEKYGDNCWIEITSHLTTNNNYLFIHKDITNKYLEEKQLSYLAHHDPLTGLANRKLFNESLLYLSDPLQKNNFAVFYMDLDGFKKVNDTYGHEFGDQLLKHVATQLTNIFRTNDIIARMGGDEFAIILTNIKNSVDVERIAQRTLTEINSSFEKEGKIARFGISIGIALFPVDATTPEEIVKCADIAMYNAKNAGKGQYHFFSSLNQ
jgi:diguanylate cyclase (GGDEF)-like protein